jgi:hypothetical protein
MSHHNRKEERDEVLFAFHQACERPTAEQIIAWTDRYPQFADDIRSHATASANSSRRWWKQSPRQRCRGHAMCVEASH